MIEITYISTDLLIPYARNSRTHDESQVSQIAASIKEFGFTNPILIDGENTIIAGHGRLMAAQKMKLEQVPCIRLDHLNESQQRALVIADNKLALNSGWDDDLLKIELEALEADGYRLELSGFDTDELSKILGYMSEMDGEVIDEGIDYQENYAVLVECMDEADQKNIFERLDSMGFKCKVLVN